MKMPALALLVGALVALPLSATAHSDGPSFASLVEGEDFGFVHLWRDDDLIDRAASRRRNEASHGHAQPPEWIGRPWEGDRGERPDFWPHDGPGRDAWHEHHAHLPPVPEPAGAAMFAAGLALLVLLKRWAR